jgi:hypothetical protein
MKSSGRRLQGGRFCLSIAWAVVGALVGPSASRAAEAYSWAGGNRAKAPFKVLYSNDCCCDFHESPYHRPGEDFTADKLRASIDEATGADVHLLQPGSCEIAWWRSKECPIDEHYRWFEERYGIKPYGKAKFVLDGGDIFEVFTQHCRRVGQAPFISLRLNDAHGKEYVNSAKGTLPSRSISQNISRFYVEHPEYRIGPDVRKWADHVYNWAEPAVRRRKLAFVRELCAYDIDGFELDFMRHTPYFRVAETTSRQRREIMTAFVQEVRTILDRAAPPGRQRWLCVRAPAFADLYDANGLDLRALVAVGVDMVNVSATYYTRQDTELAALRRLAPEAAVYAEMCHSIHKHKLAEGDVGDHNRLATPQQIYTTAHQAYARAGVDGVSFYNVAYYRTKQPRRGGGSKGYEPPFEVLGRVGDRDWLARQPQHWFLAPALSPLGRRDGAGHNQLPRTLRPGETAVLTMDMAPPTGGWLGEGKLRVQADEPLAGAVLSAKINGMALEAVDDVSDPYGEPYEVLVGKREEMRAWRVPASTLAEGRNSIQIGVTKGNAARLVYLDLAIKP